jgi:hypothetical protein
MVLGLAAGGRCIQLVRLEHCVGLLLISDVFRRSDGQPQKQLHCDMLQLYMCTCVGNVTARAAHTNSLWVIWTSRILKPASKGRCQTNALNAPCPHNTSAAHCHALQVIKGFDQAVTGLAVGESRKERIEPENAVSGEQHSSNAGLPAHTGAMKQQQF